MRLASSPLQASSLQGTEKVKAQLEVETELLGMCHQLTNRKEGQEHGHLSTYI